MPRLWRIHVDELPASSGERVALPREELHHLRKVLRLGVGDHVALFDGRGGEWTARLEEPDSQGGVTATLEREITTPVEPALVVRLYQGLCRQDRLEWVIQKATELGVASIHALRAEREEGRAPDTKRLARWSRIAAEACKQSGRRRIPAVSVVARAPAVEEGMRGLLLDPEAEVELGRAISGPVPREVWLAVGPEGGFSLAERDRLAAAGWEPVRVGPRILRTETAGLVVATILLHRWADLGSSGPAQERGI